jgi:hypothetical protein
VRAWERWEPPAGGRAETAWREAVRLIREGDWAYHSRIRQLDVLWFLSILVSRLIGRAARPVSVSLDYLEVWDPAGRLLAREPATLPVLAGMLDARRRYVLAIDLADTAAELACLLGLDALWFASSEASSAVMLDAAILRPLSEPGRQRLPFHVKQPI